MTPAPFQAILELKDRDFDRLKPTSVRPLIGRDRCQVLHYVGSRIDLESVAEAGAGESYVMPAMVYRRSPSDPAIKEMIAVIWEDETEEQSLARLG